MGSDQETTKKLDTVIKLLQHMIIIQAIGAKANNDAIRRLLGVDMNRVTQISKMIKLPKNR